MSEQKQRTNPEQLSASGHSAGISEFMTSFNMLSLEKDGRRRKKLNNSVLRGFSDHPQMAESILKSTLIANLSREGSDDVHRALESRWRKIRITPLTISTKSAPVAISIEVVFILEHTDQKDSTDEVFEILDKNILESNHDGFIAQLVVNNRVKRYT